MDPQLGIDHFEGHPRRLNSHTNFRSFCLDPAWSPFWGLAGLFWLWAPAGSVTTPFPRLGKLVAATNPNQATMRSFGRTTGATTEQDQLRSRSAHVPSVCPAVLKVKMEIKNQITPRIRLLKENDSTNPPSGPPRGKGGGNHKLKNILLYSWVWT